MEAFESFFVPDGSKPEVAKARVTHMAIGAHQDDLEIFAYHGIAECYESDSQWFAGVTVTDGGGSARTGVYQDFTDEQMKQVRLEEQNQAALLGRYSYQAQLGIPSSTIKDKALRGVVVSKLESLLRESSPEVLYLHNPADKHDTHIAVLQCCLEALQRLSMSERPTKVYGCEVWRDLDWLDDGRKVALAVDRYPELARELVAVFKSQVVGGKDYVSATLGRRRANATFYQSHSVDASSELTFAMDLSPLVSGQSVNLEAFIEEHLERFKQDVRQRIQTYR